MWISKVAMEILLPPGMMWVKVKCSVMNKGQRNHGAVVHQDPSVPRIDFYFFSSQQFHEWTAAAEKSSTSPVTSEGDPTFTGSQKTYYVWSFKVIFFWLFSFSFNCFIFRLRILLQFWEKNVKAVCYCRSKRRWKRQEPTAQTRLNWTVVSLMTRVSHNGQSTWTLLCSTARGCWVNSLCKRSISTG